MNEYFNKAAQQALTVQRIWFETVSRMTRAGLTFPANSSPPETFRQMRSGIFQALAQSWDEFMRSPQFLENMRQWMENAISFRKLTNDFMARVRNEVQAPSRDDIDNIMLNVRHMEKRLLDRLDEVSLQVTALQQQLAGSAKAKRPAASARKKGAASGTRSTVNGRTVAS